jgi:hypothetical protein
VLCGNLFVKPGVICKTIENALGSRVVMIPAERAKRDTRVACIATMAGSIEIEGRPSDIGGNVWYNWKGDSSQGIATG